MGARPDLDLTTLPLRRTQPVDGEVPAELQLIVLLGPAVGQTVPLGDGVVLGRSTPGLTIHDEGVSRRHAAVTRRADGGYTIQDLGSRNGTFVNGVRVESSELFPGDRIAIGGQTVLQLIHRDRFEDQRLQAQKLQALGELASGIAHDFNNLLGVVLANVSHVQAMSSWREDEVRKVLGEVEAAARRAGELTHDLMAFARSGPRSQETVELAHVVDDAARLLDRTLPKNITLEVHTETGLLVRGDAARLTQVLTHIGINAIDAMPDGGRLHITAERCTRVPDEMVEEQFLLPAGELGLITLRDTGLGMDAETRRHAFDPFFTTKPRGSGTGLGLATALAIVRDHGGHIGLASAPRHGTSVYVFLPVRSGKVQPERRTVSTTVPLSGCVLLVDDEALVRSSTQRVLEHAGLRVLVAADGGEAVSIYTSHAAEIDLVILDLDMPNLDGERALAAIRAVNPAARALISSGYVERAREDKLRAAGIDGTLDKPYDSVTLLRAVAAVLRDGGRRRTP